jgi:hypothetical protein
MNTQRLLARIHRRLSCLQQNVDRLPTQNAADVEVPVNNAVSLALRAEIDFLEELARDMEQGIMDLDPTDR